MIDNHYKSSLQPFIATTLNLFITEIYNRNNRLTEFEYSVGANYMINDPYHSSSLKKNLTPSYEKP